VREEAAPDAFLALGISMGLSRPGLLAHLVGRDLPADVHGLSALRFGAYGGLGGLFTATYGPLLDRYT
jgi:hypothetical protein